MMKNAALALILLSSFGCGQRVIVQHEKSPDRLTADHLPLMRRCRVVVADPDAAGGSGGLFDLAAKVYEAVEDLKASMKGDANGPSHAESEPTRDLAVRAAAALTGPFSEAKADPVSQGWEPTSTLWLAASPVQVSRRKKVEKERTYWTVYTEWRGRYVLYSEPDHVPVLDVPLHQSASDDSSVEPRLEDYSARGARRIESWLLETVTADLLPHAVPRRRLVAKGKTRAMRQAYERARAGDWAGAEGLWREAIADPSEHDRALLNLGIAAERESAWDEARRDYAAVDPKAGAAARQSRQALRELSQLYGSRPAEAPR